MRLAVRLVAGIQWPSMKMSRVSVPVASAPDGVALRSLCLSTAVCIEMHQKKFHLDWMTQS